MQFKVGNRFLERFPPTNPPYEVKITSVDTNRGCVKIHYHGWNSRCDTERTFSFCKKNWIPCTDDALKKAKESQKEALKRRQEITAAKKAKAMPPGFMEALKRKTRPRSQTEVVKEDAMLRLQTKAMKRKARPRSQTEVMKVNATPPAQAEAVQEKPKRRLQTKVVNKVIKRSSIKIPQSKSSTNITSATTVTNNVLLPKQIFLQAMQMRELMGSPILRDYTIDSTLREYLKTYHYLAKDDQEKAAAAQMLVDMFNVHCATILSKAEAVNYSQVVFTNEFLLPSSYFGPEHLFRFIIKQLTFVMENDKNWTNEKKVAVFINMPYFVKFLNENSSRYFGQALGNVESAKKNQEP